MSFAPVWLDAGYAFATATIFALVAARLTQRHVAAEARLASAMFGVWWYGVAAFLAMGAAASVLDALDVATPAARVAIAALSMLSVCAAVCGLTFYVTFVYTGRTSVLGPAAAYYAGIWLVMVVALARDAGEAERWHRSVVHLAILTGPMLSGAIVAFLVPAIVALALYAGLYRRAATAEQRYRIALATGSLLTWFGLALVALALDVADTPWWSVTGRLLALLAVGGVLAAYAPPTWVRRRLEARTASGTLVT